MADLAKFFELTSDLMGVLNADGRFHCVNAAFERVLGYSETEMRDRTLIEGIHPNDYAEAQRSITRFLDRLILDGLKDGQKTQQAPNSDERSVRVSGRYACKNGEWRWIAWTLTAENRQTSKAIPTLYCVGHDITDRMDNLARYKLLADHATDIISRQTVEGEYLYVSPACYEVLGYTPDEFMGHSRYEFIHPEDVPQIQQALTDVDGQAETFSLVFRAKHKQGHYVWMEALHRKIYPEVLLDKNFDSYKVAKYDPVDVSGHPADALDEPPQASPEGIYEIVVVARDVTARQQAEQEILELNSDLEARVAHRTAELSAAQAQYVELLKAEREGHARAELARAEAQLYAEAVQNMGIGLYIWRLIDPDDPASLTMLATNPAATQFTGIEMAEVLGKRIYESFPALVGTDVPQTYADVVKNQQSVDLGEVPYTDGRIQNGIFSVKAFPLAEDCVGISFENITERKRAEAVRQDQAAQLKVVFDQAAVGMARLSPEGQWIQVNEQLCKMLGYSREELLQVTFREVTYPEDAEQDAQIYGQLVSGESTQRSFEKRFVTQQGDIIWAYTTASTVRNMKGELMYFIATIQDVTVRKEAISALEGQKNDLITVNVMLTDTLGVLEQRNQELDQFAYVTSHDLKAPLRAIANLATWIEEDIGADLPPENAEQFELLKSRVHRMEGLINGLLEYSRIGRTHQSHERVDVAEMLSELIDSSAPPSEFEVIVGPDMPVFQAKRVPLAQVFSNLISNAIKHHDRPDGRITISVSDQGKYYEFCVADDGPGIDPLYHNRIFAIFQTLKARDELESTGIGLSLVQKAVVAEGGQIALESQVGEGSLFRFTWPKEPQNNGLSMT
ncbi:MAG: PAS domain S-box protein [Cyanobacteria bacterium J06632_3]